ncbi:MAG: hypothetical protein K2J10_01765, partial [Muribaculaceae bacterium]|nr:hypothetical protein [Muribaculaceae bacterium]
MSGLNRFEEMRLRFSKGRRLSEIFLDRYEKILRALMARRIFGFFLVGGIVASNDRTLVVG